jgi:molecular chaperone DnaK
MVFTMYDAQEKSRVEVYQGEGDLPGQNTLIGDFMVEGLSAAPAGNPIVINFDLDLNGMLKVTAREKVTGLVKSVTLDTRGQHSVNLDESRRNIATLVGPPEATDDDGATSADETESDDDPQELLATAKDLRKRGDTLLQKNLGEDDAKEIRELIHQSAVAIKESDWAALSAKNDALADLLFYLED